MIGINRHAPTPVAERGPAVGLAEDILRCQSSCAHFFVGPKDVALRVGALGKQAVGEPDGFHGFVVVYGFYSDAGFFFEGLEKGLGKILVLGAVDDDDVFGGGVERERKEEC